LKVDLQDTLKVE
jgi:hypothetical protein